MDKSTQFRHHMTPLSIISNLEKSRSGTLKHTHASFNGTKGRLKKTGRFFEIQFQYNVFEEEKKLDIGKTIKKVQFVSGKTSLVFEDFYLNRHSHPNFTGKVGFFYTKGYSQKTSFYYRLIIPLQKELQFYYIVAQHPFTTDIGYKTRSGTMATIHDDDIYVSVIHDEKVKRYYLSIESHKRQPYKEFSEKAFAVINGIGYLTGYLAGNSGYFFAYTKRGLKDPKHFYFCSLRNTIISGYTPIYTNPFGKLYHKRRAANKYYKEGNLRVILPHEFSSLCKKLYDSTEFTSAIILILESSVGSLLLMPAGYAIALERLSGLILGKTKVKSGPIPTKELSKNIRDACKEIIDQHTDAITPENIEVLKFRIDQLNQMTNKAKLRAPFIHLGISLNASDEAALDTRNEFLHGRFPDIAKIGSSRTDDQINRDLVYSAFKLYTLLNMLILKWIGFDNYALNYAKIEEDYLKYKLDDEEYYRKV